MRRKRHRSERSAERPIGKAPGDVPVCTRLAAKIRHDKPHHRPSRPAGGEADQKVFLIVENLRVHKAHKVTAWIEQGKDRIELLFLPAYAPEHNPDEFLNNDVKQSMAKRPAAKSKDALKASLRSFFTTPSTSYAA